MSLDFPVNPEYGEGCYRRRVLLLRRDEGCIEAALEDTNHAFALRVEHDRQRITAIRASAPRVPLDVCPGATAALQELVGTPLPGPTASLAATENPRQHCTHLFDLLDLALRHRHQEQPRRQLDVTIDDERDGVQAASVGCNGRETLSWQLRNGSIAAPARLAGQQLLGGGFGRWARQHLKTSELDAALLLQRGFLVAQARRYNLNATAGEGVTDDPIAAGVCYSFQPQRAAVAVRLPTVRDFSREPESLLADVTIPTSCN